LATRGLFVSAKIACKPLVEISSFVTQTTCAYARPTRPVVRFWPVPEHASVFEAAICPRD
jgi:hypothetical protein